VGRKLPGVSRGEEQIVACYLWHDGGWLPAWVVDAAQQPQLPTPGSFSDDDEMPQEPPAEGSWRAASVNSLQLVDGD